jgi:GR25 family glycosyltransferase involved in LPS biosynthesis
MDYTKVCYKLHTLAFNRVNTVNTTKGILNERVPSLSSPTVGIFNQEQLNSFMDQNPDFKLNLSQSMRPLKYPEIGLWASNFLAIKEFLASSNDYLILVEDDIKLNENFYTKFEQYMEESPSDMDCFLMFKPDNIFFVSGYESLTNEESFHTSSPSVWIAHQSWSTGCVVLNRQGAQKVLDYIANGISDAIDIFIFGNQSGQYDVSSNSRALNVYSPSKTEEMVAELHIYNTLIQNGQTIDSGN